MRPRTSGILRLALILLQVAGTWTSVRASVTFLGASGSASGGRASVAWVDGGVADSLVQTFGLSPDTVYADRSFNAAANHANAGFTVWLAASSSAYVAAAGLADSTAPVAHGALYEYDFGISGSAPRRIVAALDLALLYDADQPIVWWAIVETRSGVNPPPGPPGEVMLNAPPADLVLSHTVVSNTHVVSLGSTPNTGRLDVGALIRALRPAGSASNWNQSWGFDVFLSEAPLQHFMTGAPLAEASGLTLASPRPNPALGGTTLSFTLPAPGRATLEIVDVAGRHVRTLVDGALPAGTTGVRWNGDDARGGGVRAGVYFARLSHSGNATFRRIVLTR